MLLQILGLLIAALLLGQVGYGLASFVRQRRRSRYLLELRIDQALQDVRDRQPGGVGGDQTPAGGWSGYRKFEVERTVVEDGKGVISSFYLVPHDHRPLPDFRPGQFLTFQLDIQSHQRRTLQGFVLDQLARRQDHVAVRCYSLSDTPHPERYRVTIKRLPPPADAPSAPPGLTSTYLHDHVRVGDILNVKAPSGTFGMELRQRRPVVLIGGGVGVTPLLSMLYALSARRDPRQTWFFYGVRSREEEIDRDRLEAVRREHAHIQVHWCYSAPKPGDVADPEVHHAERVTVDLLRRLLPSNQYQFFVCGPSGMMADVHGGLIRWGVPERDITYEAFSSVTVKRARSSLTAIAAVATDGLRVTFARSGKTCEWTSATPLLLELAEANGVDIESGCRVGNCNTCLTAIREGEVAYIREPNTMPEKGSCLTCIAIPKTDLVLDA